MQPFGYNDIHNLSAIPTLEALHRIKFHAYMHILDTTNNLPHTPKDSYTAVFANGIVKQLYGLGLKISLNLPPLHNSRQDEDLPGVTLNDNLRATVGIQSFDTLFYIGMKSWFILDQNTNLQHSIIDVDLTQSREFHDSSRSHGVEYISDTIPIKAISL